MVIKLLQKNKVTNFKFFKKQQYRSSVACTQKDSVFYQKVQ